MCLIWQEANVEAHSVVKSGLPHFLDNRLRDVCEVVSLTHRSLGTSGKSLVLISVRGWAIVRLEGLVQLKNPTAS
jgi:hypothetical protein